MTSIIPFFEQMPARSSTAIEQVIRSTVSALRKGEVILYPTDTIWGLGCDSFNEQAVDRIFRIKRRKREVAFILLVDSPEMLVEYVGAIPEQLHHLIDVPGSPLTAIYPSPQMLPGHLLANDGSVAIRIVQHALIKCVISEFGRPIISTSANTSGHTSPSDFSSIERSILENSDFILPVEFDTSNQDTPSHLVLLKKDGELQWLR